MTLLAVFLTISAMQLTVSRPMSGVSKHAESKEAEHAIVKDCDMHVGHIDGVNLRRYHTAQLSQ